MNIIIGHHLLDGYQIPGSMLGIFELFSSPPNNDFARSYYLCWQIEWLRFGNVTNLIQLVSVRARPQTLSFLTVILHRPEYYHPALNTSLLTPLHGLSWFLRLTEVLTIENETEKGPHSHPSLSSWVRGGSWAFHLNCQPSICSVSFWVL